MTGEENIKPPKHSIVLRFWSTPQEIEVDEIVFYKNRVNQQYYYKFIDSTGRLWENVPEDDVIVIENYPEKEHLEYFHRLKKQGEDDAKRLSDEPEVYRDVSII